MKIEGHGQVKILTQAEIELLFNDSLQTPRDRTLFLVCLYTACQMAVITTKLFVGAVVAITFDER
jgi:integrase/recombinase XerD